MQCNVDANYPDVVQTSQVKGRVPDKTALMPDMSYKFRGVQTTHTSDQLPTTLWASTIPSDAIIHWNHL